ncbi:hypothetical protein J2795_002312 [Chryseobacterium bernardetii]|uniref:Outer membrane protein with beta-barrel domain n=2 Tax=Chryseobacterium TaxID=59732 RepID=A0A543EG49_9FLAO|nr:MULTISPECIES: hypothetical protein [Chryseobacterium]MDR6370600.1 hypothetical protein [Chryseobacterium vietnamense]MDR6441606.1 hypothetical protein [Chryseobacterium bernardetii]TQM20558.1 hypothetical protein FB551_0229 [Chryseobacterium aquifrigidense]
MKNCFYAAGLLISGLCFSQETSSKLKVSFFDGIAAAGYVDHGAFINFTGPNVSLTCKNVKFILGMLPSLRIKEDRSSGTKNSPIMPTLAAGFTMVYKKIALQIPAYYNTKTADQNGTWKIGIGLGYSFR